MLKKTFKKIVLRIDKVQKSVNDNGILLCMCNRFGIYTYKLLIKSNHILINSMYWGKKVFFYELPFILKIKHYLAAESRF